MLPAAAALRTLAERRPGAAGEFGPIRLLTALDTARDASAIS
jgi:hypothetical protein